MPRNLSKILGVVIALSVFSAASTSFASLVTLADPDFNNGNSLDGWNSNMVIQESYNYTNTSGTDETVCVLSWCFDVGADRGRLTPFIVSLNDVNGDGNLYDDNNFTVEWIGSTAVSDLQAGGAGAGDYGGGDVGTTVDIAQSGKFTLAAGETIAIAFMNSNPDGTGTGNPGSAITWAGDTVTAGQMWYNGNGAADTYPNGVATDGVLSGAPAANVQNRSYNFGIKLDVVPVPEPTGVGLLLAAVGFVGLRRKR